MSSVALDPAGWPGTLPPVSVLGTSELTDTDLGYLHALHEADRHTYEFVAGPTVPQVLRAVIEYGWDGEAPVTYVVRAGAHADPGMDPDTIVAAMQVWYSNYDNLTNAYPGPADFFYLAGDATLVVALALLAARSAKSGFAAHLDALIVAFAVGIAAWPLVFSGSFDVSSLSAAVSAAYPVADLLLLGVLGDIFEPIGDFSHAAFVWVRHTGPGGAVFALYAEESGIPVLLPGDVFVRVRRPTAPDPCRVAHGVAGPDRRGGPRIHQPLLDLEQVGARAAAGTARAGGAPHTRAV